MKKLFSLFVILCIFALVACSGNEQETATPSNAESNTASSNYPEKPIQFIIPFSAGGITDSVARILVEGAQKHLPNNQTLVPLNVAGAGGSIGMTQLQNSAADGYTIGFANTDAVSVQPALTETPYANDSFDPIVKLTSAPFVMSVNLDAQWKTFDELITYIKENPGQFTYGSSSVGSPPQIIMEYLGLQEGGLQSKHVPYEGNALLPALLGGNIDAYAGTAANFQAGTVNALVNFSNISTETLAEVPTLKDYGYDMAVDLVMGIVGPKGLDAEIKTILHDAFSKAIEDEAVIEKIENLNVAVTYGTAEELQTDFTNTADMYKEVLEQTDLK